MCAIAGEICFNGRNANVAAVEKMSQSMRSRGPDGSGIWHNQWVAFGHRRLEVIDLSARAAQPMSDEKLNLTVTFNGCIYNHAELRSELSQDFTFNTTSDTEVALKAYARWGEDFVDHLTGMFALAIYDGNRNCVVLARDRLGVKPLYYSSLSDRFRFASTVPGLLASGGINEEIDEVALHHYLSWHSIVPAPRTILRSVKAIPPATVLTIDAEGKMKERRYWSPTYDRAQTRETWDESDWTAQVGAHFSTAVRRRLVADVDVGVLLSGGLDSSMIVAEAAKHCVEPLPTFSIGFDSVHSDAGDEFKYSDLVAKHFGTEHHRIHIDGRELAAAIPETVEAMTEPMASHDVAAFYLLSQATAPHVKVVLSGQGADEVFAGYDYHQNVADIPRTAAAQAFSDVFHDRSHEALNEILEPQHRCESDVSKALVNERMSAGGARSAIDAVLRLDAHTLMPDDPVKRVDSMAMSAGLEARVPFLDQDLVELAASCPPGFKVMSGGKGVLKQVARRLLPSVVIDRPKGYFPVPGLRNLEGEVLDHVQDVMTNQTARHRGLFRQDYVKHLLENPNRSFDRRGGNTLWALAVLETWLQTHTEGSSR